MPRQPYTYAEILEAYKAIGVSKGRTVVVHSDLTHLSAYTEPGKDALLDAHYNALLELLGADGTLCVHTGDQSLCNTDRVFNLDTSPSYQMGMFSEHVRLKSESVRSFHPFINYSAVGKDAGAITENVSRHVWGAETPKARLIDSDAICVSVGIHPRLTCSTIHHVEMVMGVPYRYTKEFLQPVERAGRVTVEPFYSFVCYMACEIDRNKNQKVFGTFQEGYEVREVALSRGSVFGYSVRDFYKSATASLRDNIFEWLNQLPETKPYRL